MGPTRLRGALAAVWLHSYCVEAASYCQHIKDIQDKGDSIDLRPWLNKTARAGAAAKPGVGAWLAAPFGKQANLDLVPRLANGMPKLIHQSWSSRKTVPPQFLRWAASWMETHPDWTHLLWDDCDNRAFVATYYPDFLYIYDGYPHAIQRADAARCLVLHRYGGLYVDLDYEAVGDMSRVLDEENKQEFIVKSAFQENELLQNSMMASIPDAVFWKRVLQLMTERRPGFFARLTGWTPVLYTTGPVMLSDAYRELEGAALAHVRILPSNAFHKPGGKYAVHHNAYSWRGPRMRRTWVSGVLIALGVLLALAWWLLKYQPRLVASLLNQVGLTGLLGGQGGHAMPRGGSGARVLQSRLGLRLCVGGGLCLLLVWLTGMGLS